MLTAFPILETFEMPNFAIYLIIKAFNVHNWKLLPNNKLQSFFHLRFGRGVSLSELESDKPSGCQVFNQA